MANPQLQNFDLPELLMRPRETLDIEIKGWLNLEDNAHRADLAKAIIALANHGGGYILLGYEEDNSGQFAPAPGRPVGLVRFSQDSVSRYSAALFRTAHIKTNNPVVLLKLCLPEHDPLLHMGQRSISIDSFSSTAFRN